MCGIVGQINKHKKIDAKLFCAMRDTLYHRGPDGFGTEILSNGRVAFGHRRLSIIDLSEKGKQPMCNEDGTIWLTFNGEIYNFHKLKKELLQKGHLFKSNTDSEILIHGYEEWGIEGLLPKLKGMFAFAIWDENCKKLYAARDRFGIKPFYFYRDQHQLIFASEIKAIVKNPDVEKEIDESALADFFIYSYVPNPKSIWKQIKKLPPAHYCIFDTSSDKMMVTEYWKLEVDNKFISDSVAINRTNELIKNSTMEHMVSDVPVGLFLSGGYDSATLLMHMSDLKYNVSSYSIGFENSDRSEHRQAKQIASGFHTNHNELILEEKLDIFSLLEKLSYYYDEPFAISSMIPYYYVSKFASKYTKVTLAGDGGDEAFAGYNWHYYIKDYYSKFSIKRKLKEIFFGKEKLFVEQYDRWMTGVFKDTTNNNILNKEITSRIKKQEFWLFRQNYFTNTDPVKAFQYLDLKTFIPEPCLTRADRSSMANSLEVRVPFLDHEIFEFIFQLDTGIYLKNGVKKFLVKSNIKDRIDNNVLDMPKRGFSFQHLNNLFDKRFDELIRGGFLNSTGILNSQFNFQNMNNNIKFHLLILELWFQKYYKQ